MTTHEAEVNAVSAAEQRRNDAGYDWATYFRLNFLSNAKHIAQDESGKWRQDSHEHGATGDGANLFVLVKDTEGTHAVKVGAGEFSPRTFQEDGNYYGHGEMPYATKLQKLTTVTPVYVLEQSDGYFNLDPTYKPKEYQQFTEDPASYLATHARMVARDGGVDFGSQYYDRHSYQTGFTPSYANEHGGGMVDLQPASMQPISIEDFEATLQHARSSDVAAVAVSRTVQQLL